MPLVQARRAARAPDREGLVVWGRRGGALVELAGEAAQVVQMARAPAFGGLESSVVRMQRGEVPMRRLTTQEPSGPGHGVLVSSNHGPLDGLQIDVMTSELRDLAAHRVGHHSCRSGALSSEVRADQLLHLLHGGFEDAYHAPLVRLHVLHCLRECG